MYRHFQVDDQVRIVNANAANFEQEGIIIATTPNKELFEPDCTVKFTDGAKHTYRGVELTRLNRDEDETVKKEEWSTLDQLLDDDGYHGFRIVVKGAEFEPQHYGDEGWQPYGVLCQTPEAAMRYAMEQPLEL